MRFRLAIITVLFLSILIIGGFDNVGREDSNESAGSGLCNEGQRSVDEEQFYAVGIDKRTEKVNNNTTGRNIYQRKIESAIERLLEAREFSEQISIATIEEISDSDNDFVSASNASGDFSNFYTGVSESDLDLLARLIYHEANNQSFEGKLAVGNVVMNRVNSDKFPGSIRDVIFQKIGDNYQFLPESALDFEMEIPEDCIFAAQLAIEGVHADGVSAFFINPDIASENRLSWFMNHLEYVETIGDHDFYKLPD